MRDLGHGQIWWAQLDRVRPAVVLTRDRIAPRMSRVLVVPITSNERRIPSEVSLGPTEGLTDGSVANLDNVQLIPVADLLDRIGSVSLERWPEFCRAMSKVMAC